MRQLTFLLAPDSFKECMTATVACASMQRGIAQVFPNAEFIHAPMADGGEGTLDALTSQQEYHHYQVTVQGPNQQPVLARYAISADG